MKLINHRKPIVGMIVSGIIGAICRELSKIDISFGAKINKFFMGAVLGISLVIISYLIVTIIYIRSNYRKVNLDNIPKSIERKVSNTILFCTIQAIIGLTWGALVFDIDKFYSILAPAALIFIAVFLLTTTMKYFNYLYPNKKMNLFQNGAEKKYFDKLDDGEKWVTYNCSYVTFNKMQWVFTVAIITSMLLSTFLNIPSAVPMVIGVIWIIQNLIYFFEAKKYEENVAIAVPMVIGVMCIIQNSTSSSEARKYEDE